MPSLVWNPLIHEIARRTNDGDAVVACISAYCTVDGLRRLLQCCKLDSLYVVTRWRTLDLALGVSDLGVYPLLKGCGVRLYINYALHSKIYLFSSGAAMCGSGNATARGLGLTENCNIETGIIVSALDISDEIQIKKLRDSCVRVTDEVYEDFCSGVAACELPLMQPLDDSEAYETYRMRSEFLLSDLPAMKDPLDVIELVANAADLDPRGEMKARFVNDCCNYALIPGMGREEAEATLKHTFRESPFVKAIVEEIRKCGTMRFGAVTGFVHAHCRDVPVPYRRDVKECVNTLYNWLVFSFDDLIWDVPGARSQVIRVKS